MLQTLSRHLRGRAHRFGEDPAPELAHILRRLGDADSHAERVELARRLLAWVNRPLMLTISRAGVVRALARVRHLLRLGERDPQAGRAVRASLVALIREADAEQLWASGGIPVHGGFWNELYERLLAKLLPRADYSHDALALIASLLADAQTAAWLRALPATLIDRLARFFAAGPSQGDNHLAPGWAAQVGNALMILAAQAQAAGLGADLRSRMMDVAPEALDDHPFTTLMNAVRHVLRALAARHEAPDELAQAHLDLRRRLASADELLASVYRTLDTTGVSVHIVYRIERARAQLRRIGTLVDMLVHADPVRTVRLVIDVALALNAMKGVRGLVDENARLLSRRIVERNAQTGEHYIAFDRAEWRRMLWISAGGGAVMTFAVFFKFLLAGVQMPMFFEGFFASLNYALIFVIIQLSGLTVATKQPAMTAPALAAGLGTGGPSRLHRIVRTCAALVRSQCAAIAGNLLVIVPCVLAVCWAWATFMHVPGAIGEEKARAVLAGHSILGPSALFAAYTGVLLWLSGLFAGWLDNAFSFRHLHDALSNNRRLVRWLGAGRAARIAGWLRANIGSLGGNIGLGLLLGLTPAFAHFFGIPLEVRHVTLATGQVTTAAYTLGSGVLSTPEFWLAVGGLVLIGPLNVMVSFWLAFRVALKARAVSPRERRIIFSAVGRRLRSHPREFLFPPPDAGPADAGEAVGGAAPSDGPAGPGAAAPTAPRH